MYNLYIIIIIIITISRTVCHWPTNVQSCAPNSIHFLLICVQDAGEQSVANIDKLRHANGSITPAQLRLKMQKVMFFNEMTGGYLALVVVVSR